MWQSFACKYLLHFWEEVFLWTTAKTNFQVKTATDNNIMPRGVSAKEEGQKKMQIRWTRKLSEYFFFLWKKNRNLLKSSWLSSPAPSKKVIVISKRCQDSQQYLYQKLQNHAKSSNLQNNSFKKAGYSSKKSVRGSVQIRKGVVLQALARHVMNKCLECPVKVSPL